MYYVVHFCNVLIEKKALYSALKQQSIPVTVGEFTIDFLLIHERLDFTPGGVKLELVIDELKEIADDWKQFGGHLMSKYLLEKIELQEESPVKCLELVIVKWKQVYPDGTWMDIAAALEKIEKSKLASIIQQKYVRPVALESSSKSEGNNFTEFVLWRMIVLLFDKNTTDFRCK